MEISEQWFSLRSGSGGQSLGIDLFKTRSSAIDKLAPTMYTGQSNNQPHVKSLGLFIFSIPPKHRAIRLVQKSSQDILT